MKQKSGNYILKLYFPTMFRYREENSPRIFKTTSNIETHSTFSEVQTKWENVIIITL